MTHIPKQNIPPPPASSHLFWMEAALAMAAKALPEDVPVGALIIRPVGETVEVLARACNRREKGHDPTAHAEILALREAGEKIGDWRLTGCTLYVTLEPCPMCMAAIIQARIPRVVFGASDPMLGAAGSRLLPTEVMPSAPQVEILGGIHENACKQALQEFFENRRNSQF